MTMFWLQNLVSYSLQVLLLIGCGIVAVKFLRLRAGAAVLAFWQVLLLACLVLPACQPWVVSKTPAALSAPEANLERATPAALPSAAAPPALPSISRRLPELALPILAAGVAARVVWLMIGFWSLRSLRRRASPVLGEAAAALERAGRRLGVRAEFRTSSAVATPITFGLLKPAILLPAGICDMEPRTREAIALHELVHVKRRDWAWCVLEEAVRALWWFHPAVGWLIGRIHLTREQVVDQAVVGLMQSRDQYVDALVAVARGSAQRQLIPAPLFLRRGLLKQRIAEIFVETRMSKSRLISSLVVTSVAVLLTAGAGARVFPLATSVVESRQSSEPIQILQGGENLAYRAALVYPGRALERGIQGDVVVEVTTDERGQVSDARVLSGPDELRRSCLQSILQWRYAPPAPMPATTQVVIRFQIPREGAAKELVLPPDPDWKKSRVTAEGQVELQVSGASAADLEKIERQMVELKAAAADPSLGPEDREKIKRQWAELSVLREKIRGNEGVEVVANKIAVEKHGLPQDIERQIEELKAGIEDPNASPERKEEWKRQLAAVKSQLESARAAGPAKEPVFIREQAIPIAGTLAAISSERVNQPTMDALGPRLGIRVGDRITPAIAKQVAEKVRAFDASLRAVFHVDEAGNVILVIVGP